MRERGERIQVAERSLVRARPRDQLREIGFDLRECAGVEIDRSLAEHRRARARERAGLAAEAQVGDAPVDYAYIHVQRVATQGIGAIGRMRGMFEHAETPRRTAVFEYEFMVWGGSHTPSVTRAAAALRATG